MHVLRPRSTEPRGLVGCTGEQPPQGPLAFTAPLPVLGEQRGAAAVTCAACSPAVHARRPVLLTGTLGGLGPAARGRGSVLSGLCTAVTRGGRLSRLSPVGGLLPPPHQGQRRDVSAACGGRPSSLDGSRIQFRATVGQGPRAPKCQLLTATPTPRHLARSVLRARSRGSPASGPFRASRHLHSLPGLARRGLAHRRLSPFPEVPGATTGPRPGADDPRTVSGGSTPQGGDSAGPRGHRRRVSVASGGHEPWNCQAAPRRGGGALCAESLQAAGGTGCDSGCSLKPAALPECPVPTCCRRREFGEVWPREGCLGRVCGHPWSSHPGHRVGGAQGGRSAPHTRTPPQRVAWPRRPDVSGAGGACPRPPCARHGGLSGTLSLRLPGVGGGISL